MASLPSFQPQVALFKQCRARKLLITPPGMQHPSLIRGCLRIRDPPDHLQMVDFDYFSRKIPYFGLVILRQVSKIGDMDSPLSIPKTPSLTHLRFQWPNLLTIQEFPDGNDGRTIRTHQLWLIPDEHQAWHSALVPRGKKSDLTRYDIKLRRIQLHTNYLMKPRMAQYHPFSRIAAPVTLTPKKINSEVAQECRSIGGFPMDIQQVVGMFCRAKRHGAQHEFIHWRLGLERNRR